MKFYVSALVGVIIKVILRNARCNNKDNFSMIVCPILMLLLYTTFGLYTDYESYKAVVDFRPRRQERTASQGEHEMRSLKKLNIVY